MKRLFVITVAFALVWAPAALALTSQQTQVLASTETPDLRGKVGTLAVTDDKHILFTPEQGAKFQIACSAITQADFTEKSKMLKKTAVPAIAGVIFTLGFSLFLLAARGHGYYLAINYGSQQQAMFSLGKDVYAGDVNAISACTGEAVQILK